MVCVDEITPLGSVFEPCIEGGGSDRVLVDELPWGCVWEVRIGIGCRGCLASTSCVWNVKSSDDDLTDETEDESGGSGLGFWVSTKLGTSLSTLVAARCSAC